MEPIVLQKKKVSQKTIIPPIVITEGDHNWIYGATEGMIGSVGITGPCYHADISVIANNSCTLANPTIDFVDDRDLRSQIEKMTAVGLWMGNRFIPGHTIQSVKVDCQYK